MSAMYKRCLSRVSGSLVMLLVAASLAACAHKPATGSLPDIPIKIIFDASNCPSRVDPSKPVDLSKAAGQRLVWQAVNAEGEPLDKGYQIYFDPFKGRPLRANSRGYIRSPRIASGTPVNVEYKYSIEGQDCAKDALDPRFRLF